MDTKLKNSRNVRIGIIIIGLLLAVGVNVSLFPWMIRNAEQKSAQLFSSSENVNTEYIDTLYQGAYVLYTEIKNEPSENRTEPFVGEGSGYTASSAGRWGNCALPTALPPGQMRRSTCWMRAAAKAGTTAALHRPLRRRAGRCSWRASISQSLRCVWLQRHCLPQNTRWHPALPSLSAPDGPTCCSTASRPLHRKSSGVCCARADG